MSLRLFEPPLLNPEFYDSWKQEIQLWRLASNISPSRQAPAVLSLTGQARTAILEMDISLLKAEDGMDKLVEKLDTLFLEDKTSLRLFVTKTSRTTTGNVTLPFMTI